MTTQGASQSAAPAAATDEAALPFRYSAALAADI